MSALLAVCGGPAFASGLLDIVYPQATLAVNRRVAAVLRLRNPRFSSLRSLRLQGLLSCVSGALIYLSSVLSE
ncbi:hypothetical protein [Sphingomonas aracearum]|uniref:Uncharacterized protein n=1 Tax=Sphingomonas aracearum TaxID=2283317 RepID=A0A369VXC0_9SPHN|nr:hypothetical protein [Sphingomonas aracearum]RDE07024.1 hypothetical protein DVW87_05030 [Sphingomonas aracearum]